ncbi:MAG: hypothetical protein SPI77_02580 [Corynebacterium sp.]|nr:hypothetical protein [Corynebacterium sp.]
MRKTAIAGLTAVAVALSATPAFAANVEGAEGIDRTQAYDNVPGSEKILTKEVTNDKPTGENTTPVDGDGGNISSKLAGALDGDQWATGQDIFGSSQGANLPKWAELFYAAGILGAVGTVIGTVIAVYNYAAHQGWVPAI